MRVSILAASSLSTLAACTTDPLQSAGAPDDTVKESASQVIPAPMQGRWGLVAADCEQGRSDAKGLLVIGPAQLRFYESVGTLAEINERDASRIRARFEFTGEGMTWSRDVLLDAQDDGQTLFRREYGDDASPGPLKYKRCSS